MRLVHDDPCELPARGELLQELQQARLVRVRVRVDIKGGVGVRASFPGLGLGLGLGLGGEAHVVHEHLGRDVEQLGEGRVAAQVGKDLA